MNILVVSEMESLLGPYHLRFSVLITVQLKTHQRSCKVTEAEFWLIEIMQVVISEWAASLPSEISGLQNSFVFLSTKFPSWYKKLATTPTNASVFPEEWAGRKRWVKDHLGSCIYQFCSFAVCYISSFMPVWYGKSELQWRARNFFKQTFCLLLFCGIFLMWIFSFLAGQCNWHLSYAGTLTLIIASKEIKP